MLLNRVLFCCALVLPAQLLLAAPSIMVENDVVTIKTDRYEVSWQNGSLVGLRTFLSKDAAITVDARPMQVSQLPNGLAVMPSGGNKEGALAPYKVVCNFPLKTVFPAYHPPVAGQMTSQAVPNGIRLTYTGLAGDPQALLQQELTVEPDTGDLLIRQEAKWSAPGVLGISFSLLNLRPDIVFAVPYFGGQRWRNEPGKEGINGIPWPYMWSAGLIIGELPGGGSFSVWAEDPDMRPKFFRHYHAKDVQGLNFEAGDESPYDKNRMTAFTWRLNTFAGSWQDPAKRYKDYFIKTFKPVPRSQRSSKWIDEVALIVPTKPDEKTIAALAPVIDPKHLLFMDWGWLTDLNRRVPEFTPRDKAFPQTTALAHKYGAHTGVYTSIALIDQQTHPTMMKDLGLEYLIRGPQEEKPKGVREGWLQYVHPGSTKWRESYSTRMAQIVQEYGIDYLYQDVSGCASGSSGLVEGLTFSKAVIVGEDAIREKTPQSALGGEFWNEMNACREDFGMQTFLAWFGEEHAKKISAPTQPHPLLAYLFDDYCLLWPHNVMIRDTLKFHREMNIDEVIGAIPVWNTAPDDRASEARVVLERAKLLTQGFRPYFPEKWEPSAVAYQRNAQGQIVKYLRPDQCTYCFEVTPQGDKLRYARVRGVSRLSLPYPATIDGWVAYDAKGPIGLSPENWYCVFPGQPANIPVKITDLPEGARIKGTRLTDQYCLVEIDGKGDGAVAWELLRENVSLLGREGPDGRKNGQKTINLPATLLFATGQPQPITPGEPLPLATWKYHITSNGQIVREGKLISHRKFTFSGQTHDGYRVLPPTGGKGSEISIDGFVVLPQDPSAALRLCLGRGGGAGDGVNFVVRVNGKEIWHQERDTTQGWKDALIPLGEYAGQGVVLSLAVDCGKGGFNTSNDESVWGDPAIVTQVTTTTQPDNK